MRCAVLTIVALAGLAWPALGDVIFVDATAPPGGDGTSWVSAFADLQDALAVATTGDELWIAQGTYTPAPPMGSSDDSFVIPSGVALYGGFTGEETTRSQRDPAAFATILSGDLGQDDGNGLVNLPNAHHVVTIDQTGPGTRLDGLTIRDGYGFFGSPGQTFMGAGVIITTSQATLTNCTVEVCYASHGGGVWLDSSTVTLDRCTLQGTIGSEYACRGGAIGATGTSSLTVRDTQFLGNEAEARGGWAFGGAIYTDTDVQLIVQRCSFNGNIALPRSNSGRDWCRGGAIFAKGTTTISDSTFSGNTSNVGGAIQSWAVLPNTTTILNSVLTNNRAPGLFLSSFQVDGAAGTIAGGGELTIIGCAIVGGWSDNYGGAWVGAGATVANSIFWANRDSAGTIGRSNLRASDRVYNCCIQNMLVGEPGEDPPDPQKFPGSISADPMFVGSGDYHLTPSSPCIDASNNSYWPQSLTTDLDGNPRLFDDPATPDTGVGIAPIGDIGPYEFGSQAPACPADLTGSADPNDPGFGVPDGILDANDFFFYLGLFGAGDPAADLTGSADPNSPDYGTPDGVIDASDFFYYLDLFVQGCP